ncbi:MAG: PDZ domain-containing protein [Phycisphaerales bacterium]
MIHTSSTARILFLLSIALATSLLHSTADADERAYLGLATREVPEAEGVIVGWIYPGPLEGTGQTSPRIDRGDILLQVDGVRVESPDHLDDLIANRSANEEITLLVRRTQGDASASVPTPGVGTEEVEIRVTLADRAAWIGPVGEVIDAGDRPNLSHLTGEADQPTALETVVFEQANAHEQHEAIECLRQYFRESLDRSYGANMLSRVAAAFVEPTRLDVLQESITSSLDEVVEDPQLILREAARNLDATPPPLEAPLDLTDAEPLLNRLTIMLRRSDTALQNAFAEWEIDDHDRARTRMPEIAEFVSNGFYINSHPEVSDLIRTLNSSGRIDFDALFNSASSFSPALMPHGVPAWGDDTREVPEQLADSIEGSIVAALETPQGWIVLGGPDANRYDLSRLAVVVDPGGSDDYHYADGDRPATQLVIDFAGNDSYQNNPARGLLGVSVLVDLAGSDRYGGDLAGVGAGLMGVGLLVDHAGADRYTGEVWSVGAAFYGVGGVLDLGDGSDLYESHRFSQAIGGPRGFGFLIDANGRDLYRANGPSGSVYGTDAVFVGVSQGVGFGIRGYDTGGIGLLADLAGADRYEAGEFSQGGAYYWAMGVLYDRSGRDLYYGNRYGQAFAAHQAIGILADDGGDDTYWSMTAASQSGSWDVCSTLLIDRGGNDSYQADGLAQGGASQQAIAWLVDLDGDDRYSAPGGATMGQSGGDRYHFDATGCYSWSVLLDLGGGHDLYSRGDRTNNVIQATGAPNEKNPENSSVHGLFIDSAESLPTP